MTQILYGPWWIDVAFGETHSGERFIIAGSDSSDGVYDKRQIVAGIASAPGLVSGVAWTLRVEFSPYGFLGVGQIGPFVIGNWYPSDTTRSASYTGQDYLTVTFSADYPTRPNYAERPDHGQRGLLLTCKSIDPSLRPQQPTFSPYDFTLPRETLAKFHRQHQLPPNPIGT